ncbi:hypothetical protein RhiirA4_487654 [Rhizophagus irregularis]|uniref:Uncharacterized protein n=1 Tax=Rhizophagus irregularis TaxID=588596 RepID=A0A2I1HSU8_9GLOM|nr:hypothetical protein RhiirA4_487654 [Rhizophagus irregularis]
MEKSIKNLDKYLGNIVIEVIKIEKEIKELKDQYKNKERRNSVKRKNNTCENCGGKGHFTKDIQIVKWKLKLLKGKIINVKIVVKKSKRPLHQRMSSKENDNNEININNENGNSDQKNTKGKKLYIGDDYITVRNKIL